MSAADQNATKTIHLSVPGLIERPAVGTSCCASTAEAIVAQELVMLPGIEDITIDCDAGAVTVTFRPADLDEPTLAAALEDVGYPIAMAA